MLTRADSGIYEADGIAYKVCMRGRFTIGDVVRKARKERGWDQTRLGAEAAKFQIVGDEGRVNKATISKIESGNPYTSELGVIWRVLAALDLSFAEVERASGSPFKDRPASEKKRQRAV